jgi:integrase
MVRIAVADGAGLRVSEVANPKVSDVDSKRMLLRAAQGKGKKDRHSILSPKLLALLRDYWWAAKPAHGCSPDAILFCPSPPRQPDRRPDVLGDSPSPQTIHCRRLR